MAQLGPIKFPFATVYCSAYPTRRDAVGCDGLYVERVEVRPWYDWPVGFMVRIGIYAGGVLVFKLWR